MHASTHLTQSFVEMADSLANGFDLDDFLQGLAARAIEVTGAVAVDVVLAGTDGSVTHVASSGPGRDDAAAWWLTEGPCLDSLRSGEPVVTGRSTQESATTDGPGEAWVHAVPLRLRDDVIGVLCLFGDGEVELLEGDLHVVRALTDVATIAILQSRAIADAETTSRQLQHALRSRVVIEQAKGVLAQRGGLTMTEAFEQLRARSRSTRRTLDEVAREVLDERATRGSSS